MIFLFGVSDVLDGVGAPVAVVLELFCWGALFRGAPLSSFPLRRRPDVLLGGRRYRPDRCWRNVVSRVRAVVPLWLLKSGSLSFFCSVFNAAVRMNKLLFSFYLFRCFRMSGRMVDTCP